MEEYEDIRFRVTQWPGRLPHPRLREWLPYVLVEPGLLYADFSDFPEDGTPMPRPPEPRGTRDPDELAETGEIYLELASLELESPKAILAFANRFGVLGVGYSNYGLFRELPGFEPVVIPELERSHPRRAPWANVAMRFDATLLAESVAEFRFGARCVRDLVRAWRIVEENLKEAAIEWESVPPGHGIPAPDLAHAPGSERKEVDAVSEARRFLVRMLNAGLVPFHPRLVDAGTEAAGPDGMFANAPLYAVCCLELFNHIVEKAVYRRCANETCQRIFVRQKGRATMGQYRSEGVMYCSSHCARAQAQRALRARRRTEKRQR